METITVKFGGSSLADAVQFRKVADIIAADPRRAFVVVSAPGRRHPGDIKVTDLLYAAHDAAGTVEFSRIWAQIAERFELIAWDLGLDVDLGLSELGAQDKPVIEALNKCDRLPQPSEADRKDAVSISALTGAGLDELRQLISEKIALLRHECRLLVPYGRGDVLNFIHEKGQVTAQEYTPEGTLVTCLLDSIAYSRVKAFLEER